MLRPATASLGLLLVVSLAACGSDRSAAGPSGAPAAQHGETSVPVPREEKVSTGRDAAVPPVSGPARVRLWHCGVTLMGYPDGMWEMRRPPFDATNAPASFTGHGTASVPRTDRLVYVDAGGQRLVFVPGDEVPPVLCD